MAVIRSASLQCLVKTRVTMTSAQDSDRQICHGSSQGVFLSLDVCYEQDARSNESLHRIDDSYDTPSFERQRILTLSYFSFLSSYFYEPECFLFIRWTKSGHEYWHKLANATDECRHKMLRAKF